MIVAARTWSVSSTVFTEMTAIYPRSSLRDNGNDANNILPSVHAVHMDLSINSSRQFDQYGHIDVPTGYRRLRTLQRRDYEGAIYHALELETNTTVFHGRF